ncbi:hypothetical protein AB3R30_25590 [Leptolyngbyaceae cyanobacterium UHCC 1019]
MPIRPGNLVVLTRDGCDLSANELMAIWTVKDVRDDSAMGEMQLNHQTIEELPMLNTRRYSLDWLVLYKTKTR